MSHIANMSNGKALPMEAIAPAANDDNIRIIVVGSGPVGLRFAYELLQRRPNARLTLFGDEPYLPYNRVQLSALLAGEIPYEQIISPLPNLAAHPLFSQSYARITRIDGENQCVFDQHGNAFAYDHLVLATGARAHVPNIPGVTQTGVYTFRNLKDAESLYNRISRARHIVVVGGGLLGLEAARALLRANTLVTVIQQAPRLMNRQLDDTAAHHLQRKVEALGINVITQSGVRCILGDGRVSGVVTRDGDRVICDTVLLCAGIKPVVELARAARLKVGTGIVVDDQLRTSSANIYAIGECCEHQGKTYGLVNPGFEQAAIAADVICKGQSRYVGSLQISRLKVLGENVCSMGEVADLPYRPFQREWVYSNTKAGIYRKIVTLRGRLIGAVGIGQWPELQRLQEAYQNQRKILPWQYLRFVTIGQLWSSSHKQNIALWPASTVVCQCNGITQGQLTQAYESGAKSVIELSKQTSAGTVCGSCKPLLENLVGHTGPREKIPSWRATLSFTLLATLITVFILFSPAIPVSDSVINPAPLQTIWHDHFWKQVTGFTLLGLSGAGLLMSLRKRIKKPYFGPFPYWRLAHIVLGIGCAITVILHTGMHFGENLNRLLIMDFLAVLLLGGGAGLALTLGHLIRANLAEKLKYYWTWGHILLVWPLPILIAMHILTVYYF